MSFLVATLSYMPDTLPNLEKRMNIHAQQIRWLERLGIDIEYVRLESDWGTIAKHNQDLRPSFDFTVLETGPHPCGCNRSIILDYFYETDYDWLVCMDDDRMLYPHYSPSSFFQDLNTPAFLDLARRGYMIVCLDPIYMPFKKENYEWPYHETHWKMHAENPHGCLQICFIPNLVKYGFSPIFFDRETRAQANEAPEDLKFEIDWLLERHPIIKCTELIMKEIGQQSGNGSTIYTDLETRREIEKTQSKWLADYLKEKSPKNSALWTKKGLVQRRNPLFTDLIPRSQRYVFKDSELPKGMK